jgi:hypothetical protein
VVDLSICERANEDYRPNWEQEIERISLGKPTYDNEQQEAQK